MRPSQLAVLKMLSAAFKTAEEADLCFVGMEKSIIAFDRKDLFAAGYGEAMGDATEIMRSLEERSKPVETHGTYLDSGAW